jgi:MinD-like ATPase involved in chromosome partitioning or flagellar assembly
MRVLVFDPNVDFARRAVEFIRENVRNAQAEMASNVFVLRHCLREQGPWDFVVADVAAAGFMGDVIDELKSLACPVVVWSTLEDTVYSERDTLNKFRLIKKPKTPDQLSTAIHNMVETA